MKKPNLVGRKLTKPETWKQDFHDPDYPDDDFFIFFKQLSHIQLYEAREKAGEYYRYHVDQKKPVGAVDGQPIEIATYDGWLLIATLECAQVPQVDDEGREVVFSYLEFAQMAAFDTLLVAMQESYFRAIDKTYTGALSEETSDPLPSGDLSS